MSDQNTNFEILSNKLDDLKISINEFKNELKSKNIDLELRLKTLEKRETEMTTEIKTLGAILRWAFGGGLVGLAGVLSWLVGLKK
jgi:hypothetical protein